MLEGVVQIVCPHCDHDNRIPRERLRNPPPCLACRGALFEGRAVFLDDERRFDKHVRHIVMALPAVSRAAWSGDSGALQLAFEAAAPQLEPNARLATVDGPALPDLAGRLNVVRLPEPGPALPRARVCPGDRGQRVGSFGGAPRPRARHRPSLGRLRQGRTRPRGSVSRLRGPEGSPSSSRRGRRAPTNAVTLFPSTRRSALKSRRRSSAVPTRSSIESSRFVPFVYLRFVRGAALCCLLR